MQNAHEYYILKKSLILPLFQTIHSERAHRSVHYLENSQEDSRFRFVLSVIFEEGLEFPIHSQCLFLGRNGGLRFLFFFGINRDVGHYYILL